MQNVTRFQNQPIYASGASLLFQTSEDRLADVAATMLRPNVHGTEEGRESFA